MQRASWKGLYARDNGQQRPFTLSRSTFLGSQRYGAMWTGDNKVAYYDIHSYLSMGLSLGVSGMAFHGADMPGFALEPIDENFI